MREIFGIFINTKNSIQHIVRQFCCGILFRIKLFHERYELVLY